jgi:sulfatase modifying factor 1
MAPMPTRTTVRPYGMAQITGGTFRMGSDVHYPEERPADGVTVDGFWIDRHAVTDADFAAFVAATHYVTFAERPLDPAALYPGARPQLLTPGSAVFAAAAGRSETCCRVARVCAP